MNNSKTMKSGTLGVLHKAIVVNKDESKDRVINSAMLYLADMNEADLSVEEQQRFLMTEVISR